MNNNNSNLYTDETVNIEGTFLTYNINTTFDLQKYAGLRWQDREEKVVKIIKKINPDIMNLQELRALEGCTSNQKFLTQFEEYDFFRSGANPSPLALQQAIGWKTSKYFATEYLVRWLAPESKMPNDINPKGWGCVVLFVKLHHHINGKLSKNDTPFWIVNVHFPILEDDKNYCLEPLTLLISEVCKGHPYILSGDFNTFMNLQGKQQIDYLSKNLPGFARNATDDMVFSQSSEKCTGTFIGTSYDKFKYEKHNLSHLDHIFVSHNFDDDSCIAHTETMEFNEPNELSKRDLLPSDHLPISFKFSLVWFYRNLIKYQDINKNETIIL